MVDTEDIGILVSREVTELDLSSSEVRQVGDHLFPLEFSRNIGKQFDKSIIIYYDDIIITVTIHIFRLIRTDIATISCRNQGTDSSINSFISDSYSITIDVCYWISEIDHRIAMVVARCFSDRISSSIGKEESIFIMPTNSWYLRKS